MKYSDGHAIKGKRIDSVRVYSEVATNFDVGFSANDIHSVIMWSKSFQLSAGEKKTS